MTDEQAMKLLAYLRAAYPRQELPTATIGVYADALRDVEYEQAFIAARKHIAHSPFWPAVSELLGLLVPAVDPAEQQWGEVTKAISRWGRYRPWKFDSPLTSMTVEAMGRDEICKSENLAVERAHFLRIYGSYRESHLRQAREAPMLTGRTGPVMVGELAGRKGDAK